MHDVDNLSSWYFLLLSEEHLLFSIGKPSHYEWYSRLLIHANMEDMHERLDKIDVIASALYGKKKVASFACFTIPSTMENLLGLETPTSISLQDQMTMWLDRILDGTAEKKHLDTWPTL